MTCYSLLLLGRLFQVRLKAPTINSSSDTKNMTGSPTIDSGTPNQLNGVLFVLVNLVAFPQRQLCFKQPGAHLVPFVFGIAESIGLLASWTAHNFVARKHIVYGWPSVYDLGQRNHN
jgi:hypothetical protein